MIQSLKNVFKNLFLLLSLIDRTRVTCDDQLHNSVQYQTFNVVILSTYSITIWKIIRKKKLEAFYF